MTARTTPVEDLLKLVDACNRCSLAFRAAGKHLSDIKFCGFYERLQKTLHRFIFELEKESSRIGGPLPDTLLKSRCASVTTESLMTQAEAELQSTLEGYDVCLTRSMPAHARAMIVRQRQSLAQLMADLVTVSSDVPMRSVR